MRFLLFLLFTFSVYALEDYQGKKIPIEDWRCGAPLVKTFAEETKFQKPLGLKRSLKVLSKLNLKRFWKNIKTLSNKEKRLYDLITKKFHAPIIHRTNLYVMKLILPGKGELISPQKRGVEPEITPEIEQSLFSANDCIFATVGPPYGIKDYGSVIVRIKNFTNFAWGSIYTGWSWTKDVAGKPPNQPATNKMKFEFAKQIFTNDDFDEAIALQIISHIRNGTSLKNEGKPYNSHTILDELLQETKSYFFWRKVFQHRLGYLEAHYTDNIPLSDVGFIEFRTMDMKDVHSWKLDKRWFANAPNSFIRWFNRSE